MLRRSGRLRPEQQLRANHRRDENSSERQARTWLRADLALRARQLDLATTASRLQVRDKIRFWKTDVDLRGIRDADMLDKLPAAEQQECRAALGGSRLADRKSVGRTPALSSNSTYEPTGRGEGLLRLETWAAKTATTATQSVTASRASKRELDVSDSGWYVLSSGNMKAPASS